MNTTRPATVLVADDEPSIRAMVARLLTPRRYDVLAASDGNEAVRVAGERRPDAVLLDVHMEGGGVRALQRLRRDPRTRLIPVILLTGDARPEIEIGGLEEGADDFIAKPFEASELLARLGALLRRTAEALTASPLTGLPGAPAVEREISARIEAGGRFAFIYADIDRFKTFNDRYGYARGDQLIRRAAQLLVECAGDRDLAAHIGGDDFVLICEAQRAEEAAHRLAAAFDAAAPEYYDAEDRLRGWVEARGRDGAFLKHRLATLSIAGVRVSGDEPASYGGLVESAARFKAILKELPSRAGSVYGFT